MQWNVGQVKVTRIVELPGGGGRSSAWLLPQATPEDVKKIPWLVPRYAEPEGNLILGVRMWIVETPTMKILFDTGVGNGKENRDITVFNDRKGSFLADIEAAGYPADSIGAVICTHLHVDHVGWNTKLENGKWVPTFPNARYLFGKDEYNYLKENSATGEYHSIFADSVQPIVDAGLSELIDSNHRVSDEITALPTPGHSAGHLSFVIKSGQEQALIMGDICHTPAQMVHLDWSSTPDHDSRQAIETRREVLTQFADTDTMVFGVHFEPGRIVKDGDVFKMRG